MIYYVPTPLQINWVIENDRTIIGKEPNQYTGMLYSWIIETNILIRNNSRTFDPIPEEATSAQVKELIWHIFNVKKIYV